MTPEYKRLIEFCTNWDKKYPMPIRYLKFLVKKAILSNNEGKQDV